LKITEIGGFRRRAPPRITEQAEADLEELWEYLAERNEEAADRILNSILEKARLHAQFPRMGRPRDDLAPGLRSFVVAPYVVFFQAIEDTIEVIRVLHGSRDIDSIMRTEEE
jgi:toxin ParE1/3/4